MAEVILIPGYATEFSTLFRPSRGADGGFAAFANEVVLGKAIVFRWGIREHVPLHRAVNPFYLIGLYRRERRLAVSATTFDTLKTLLEKNEPKNIVCHSMGCLLLVEYLKKFVLPSSVEQIIFVQADFSATTLVETNVPVKNFFCPWDSTLCLSALFHRRVPAGLAGAKGRYVANHLFPLWRLPNLHTSSIRDPKLLKRL